LRHPEAERIGVADQAAEGEADQQKIAAEEIAGDGVA
jgi:hypothetical protein